MSQHSVQSVIGKLITDADFRHSFEQRAGDCLTDLVERGVDLTEHEIATLTDADPHLWSRMATLFDGRVQRASIATQPKAHSVRTHLTERQQHVLHGVFEGRTNKEIAAHAGVSESAVKATLQQLFRKMLVRTRAQLVRIAIEDSLGAERERR